jgi:hypothetical protein
LRTAWLRVGGELLVWKSGRSGRRFLRRVTVVIVVVMILWSVRAATVFMSSLLSTYLPTDFRVTYLSLRVGGLYEHMALLTRRCP